MKKVQKECLLYCEEKTSKKGNQYLALCIDIDGKQIVLSVSPYIICKCLNKSVVELYKCLSNGEE